MREKIYQDDWKYNLVKPWVGSNVHYEAEVEDDGGDMAYPFKSSEGVYYRFFYYDPNYAVKLAFAKGAKIQYRHRELSLTDSWRDIDNPTWSDTMEYRKPSFSMR